MADLSNYPQQDNYTTRLASKYSAGDSTMIVQSAPDFTYANPFYLVLEPNSSSDARAYLITGISGTTVTVSGSAPVPRYVGDSPTSIDHPSGSTVVLSNNYQTWEDIRTAINAKVDNDADDTITADTTWSSTSKAGIVANNITESNRDGLASSPNGAVIYNSTSGQMEFREGGAWVANASGGSVADASTTVAGKTEIATAAERAAGTATGDTGAVLVPSNDALVKTSSGAGDENKIPVLNSSGELADGFINDIWINDSLLTAKGSIATASAASTPAELVVGSPLQNLQPDPNESGGLVWAYPRRILFDQTIWTNDATGTGSESENAFGFQTTTDTNNGDAENYTTNIPVIGGAAVSLVSTWATFNGEVFELAFRLGVSSASSINWYCGIMTDGSDGVGNIATTDRKAIFKCTNNTVESSTADGTTEEDQSVTSVSTTQFNVYRIRMIVGTSVAFYVNDTLKTTHTTNVPTTIANNITIGFGVGTTSGAKSMVIDKFIDLRTHKSF